MKSEIETAIKYLAKKSHTQGSTSGNDAMKYTQAVLNLSNALATLACIPKSIKDTTKRYA